MKTKMLKLAAIAAMGILISSGAALAGGGRHSFNSYRHGSPGYHGGGHHYDHGWRGHHHNDHYRHGYHYYPHHRPPHHPYHHYYHGPYYRGWERYDGAYHFSGAYSAPGFGFTFGTRSDW